MEIVSHGWGAIQGASSPRRTMVPTMRSPALSWSGIGRRGARAGGNSWIGTAVAARPSGDAAAIADLRVEPGVEEVRREIRERVDRGNHEDCRLQRRQVPVLDREDEEAAEARVGEDRL